MKPDVRRPRSEPRWTPTRPATEPPPGTTTRLPARHRRPPGVAASDTNPAGAATVLSEWGFLVNRDLPDRPGRAYLLVALRPVPTLAHFDPEMVEYWVAEGGCGRRKLLTWTTETPLDETLSWGCVRLVDRLGAENVYLTFGGDLAAERFDTALVVAVTSPVPILSCGGHSQGWDETADDLGAFFGRLRVAVGRDPTFERAVAEADPLARYAAFVADLVTRFRRSGQLRAARPALWALLGGEGRRLSRDHPAAWQAGLDLLADAQDA